ncbi:hypothetical protein PGT21_020092 [Puccinia graminis f. sp. tritici]|uniref:Uncharacterized protein n=1 Tax=Puccinia graminis f. sp. tritici TaxID=56615 RepID=A0A5B0Q6C5_PUCGR|nr:hypothetical protein PGT21_020092 [Puccinia graminis f. sp. tritici]
MHLIMKKGCEVAYSEVRIRSMNHSLVDSFPENVRKLSGRVVSNGHSLPCKFWTPQMMSRRVSMGHQNSPVVYVTDEGAYGVVCPAIYGLTGQQVAIKKGCFPLLNLVESRVRFYSIAHRLSLSPLLDI